jgi:hypothetical protein
MDQQHPPIFSQNFRLETSSCFTRINLSAGLLDTRVRTGKHRHHGDDASSQGIQYLGNASAASL